MKRDLFRRGVRMSHQFGNTERINDPLGSGTFELKTPNLGRTGGGRSGPCEIGEYGEYTYRPQSSPVQKPAGGAASTNGPAPDMAQDVAMPIPVGTKRRLGPIKTDK